MLTDYVFFSSVQSEGFLVAIVAVSLFVLVYLPSALFGFLSLLTILGSVLALAAITKKEHKAEMVAPIKEDVPLGEEIAQIDGITSGVEQVKICFWTYKNSCNNRKGHIDDSHMQFAVRAYLLCFRIPPLRVWN